MLTEILNEFEYDPKTGFISNKKTGRKYKQSKQLQITVGGKRKTLSYAKTAWVLYYGEEPSCFVRLVEEDTFNPYTISNLTLEGKESGDAFIGYNPNTGRTLVEYVLNGKKKSKSFSSEEQLTYFLQSIKRNIRYKTHTREKTRMVFDTIEFKKRLNEIVASGESTEDGCILLDKPYKQFSFKGNNYRSHRAVFYAENPKTPQDLVVRHLCNNPRCVNIEHLACGYHQDNVNDMIISKRDRFFGNEPMIVQFAKAKNLPENCELLQNTLPEHLEMIRTIREEEVGKDVWEDMEIIQAYENDGRKLARQFLKGEEMKNQYVSKYELQNIEKNLTGYDI